MFRGKKHFEKISVGRWILASFPLWPRQHLSERSPPDVGAGRAGECSGTHGQLISRCISTQSYWLPCPFDQAQRGFIIWNASLHGHNDRCVVRRTIARNRCRGESLICQQLRCVSGRTISTSEKINKRDRKRKNIYFHEASFHAKLSICLSFVFGINRTYTHSKIMSKVQRVESWEFSRGWINEVCWLAGLHSALHEVSPWGPGWCVALILCPCASITWFGM